MRVLVTGGRGFIGSHLIGQLREKGYDVFSHDIVEGFDITNPRQLRDSFKRLQPDQVYHLAGSDTSRPSILSSTLPEAVRIS